MAQSSQAPSGPALAELPITSEEVARARLVDFRVERESEIPVGTQLAWKLRGMVARGALRPGDRLPSVRELAGFAGVNVNTARAVYGGLEDDGLIASEHGRGTYVTETASELRELGGIASAAIADAHEAGVDPRELAATIYAAAAADEAAELPADPFPELDPELGDAALRRALREQIGRLEAELAAYAWHDPHSPASPRVETAKPVGRIVGVEELERTRAELIDRLTRLRGEAERRGARERAARRHVEDMVENPAAHAWEIVSNAELGDPGCTDWRVVPRFGPLGAIMGWWRVKVSSGCP